ncbi:MAG TPA: T9SS type A sorting domain-containing protein [Flavipsychrobacter sp.]|nr:T9SS type A sorting domain-containing protein [Flavipsychrobacter sp.]
MSRIKFTFSLLLACAAFSNFSANAQYNAEILGPRLIVESPASISGPKNFTYSSNPGMTGPWGAILTPRVHEEVVRVSDSEACGAISGVMGKWALIYRGNCEFGVKALNAQNAGAIGVIIYNHTPDEMINMGAGASGGSVSLPVVFVSKQDGTAMRNQLLASQQVFISLSPWGFGKTHDLAFVNGSAAPSPGMAVPLAQLDGSDVAAFRGYTAAAVANTGSANATNVKVKSTVTFTPLGGSATPFYTDSSVLATLTTGDSVQLISSPRNFKFTPTQTGTYNFSYNLTSDNADEYVYDNQQNFSFSITNDAYSRGRYDVTTGNPVITGYSRINSTTTPWTWGPMFYVKKGGYQFKELRFALMDQDTSQHAFPNGFIDAYVFKWKDLNGDKFIQGGELSIKGAALHEFQGLDSPKKIIRVNIGDPNDGQPMTIVSEDTSHYWVAFNLGLEFRLSVDGNSNYYTRAFAAEHGTTPSFDYWAPGILKAKGDISLIANDDTIRAIPYGPPTQFTTQIDSADFTQQEAIPAVALIMGMWPVSVKNTSANNERFLTVYPNPATDVLYASLDLEKESNVYIKVMDELGRQISLESKGKIKSGKIPVDISNLTPGRYYLSVIANDKLLVRPFVKIK